MRKTRFKPPYTKKRATFSRKAFGQRPGVYLIKNRQGKIVYVGHSRSNVYKTMYRHFQAWTDPTQRRVSYSPKSGYTVRMVLCTARQAVRLESALILHHKPRDNDQKLNLLSRSESKTIRSNYGKASIIPESVDIGF